MEGGSAMNQKATKKQISLLSSDETTSQLLKTHLESNTFSFKTLPDSTALESLLNDRADVLILVEQNPLNLSAIDICKIVRLKNEEVIIIIVAEESDLMRKILALELGADDYLTKPVAWLEINARIKVTLGRMTAVKKMTLEETEFKFNDLYLDSQRRICLVNKNEIKLSNYEFLTLLYLVQSEGKTVSRATLLNEVWGLPSDDLTRPVDDIVRRLRKKLRNQQSSSEITAHWGYGYRIEVGS